MARINVLDKQIAELIAAGEVVERPASIVKELVENAIDAGATAVTVEIQAGGVRYIRVTDNGSGILREDVANAFLRHATSKVRVQEDLSNILTMGFRGEALASIAAMCRVDLLTRTPDDVAGTHYAIAGGEELVCEDAGCPAGTTITVRDVFYNTPARMKFLKKDVSEGNSVAAAVEKAALGNPGVAFKFIRDGAVKLQTPGDGQTLSSIRCVLGREFAENAIPVDYQHGNIRLTGYI
ncbi:MAG: DNA mismatch repair endonuclease MutL, partial [Anaerotruncus rubiinfantis]